MSPKQTSPPVQGGEQAVNAVNSCSHTIAGAS